MAKKGKVEKLIAAIEKKIEPVAAPVKEKKVRKPKAPVVVAQVQVESKPKVKRARTGLQLKYDNFKKEQYVKFKASGKSYKEMLSDASFQNEWKKAKASM